MHIVTCAIASVRQMPCHLMLIPPLTPCHLCYIVVSVVWLGRLDAEDFSFLHVLIFIELIL